MPRRAKPPMTIAMIPTTPKKSDPSLVSKFAAGKIVVPAVSVVVGGAIKRVGVVVGGSSTSISHGGG